MAATEERTFSLPVEQAAFIDAPVRAGSFGNASEVVWAGLRALQERDAAIARWLRDEVTATYDAMKSHSQRLISADGMAERMRQRHEARMRDGTCGGVSSTRPPLVTISTGSTTQSPRSRRPRSRQATSKASAHSVRDSKMVRSAERCTTIFDQGYGRSVLSDGVIIAFTVEEDRAVILRIF